MDKFMLKQRAVELTSMTM